MLRVPHECVPLLGAHEEDAGLTLPLAQCGWEEGVSTRSSKAGSGDRRNERAGWSSLNPVSRVVAWRGPGTLSRRPGLHHPCQHLQDVSFSGLTSPSVQCRWRGGVFDETVGFRLVAVSGQSSKREMGVVLSPSFSRGCEPDGGVTG